MSSKDTITDEMKAYCSNNGECRRKMLMAHFGESKDFVLPEYKHLCCDVCAQSCTCGACSAIILSLHLENIDIEEVEDFELLADTCKLKPLPRAKYDALKKELEEYRLRLCLSADIPGASLMVGLDIATGLSDALVRQILE